MYRMFMFISLFCIGLCMCLLIWFCFLYCASICVKFKFLSLGGYKWVIKFDFDFVTFSVVLMLVICFSYVYFYTHHYFMGDLAGFELNKIIILFVVVMGILVSTGDFLTTLVFWEYLGVVRFFLILFYDKFLRLRSSVVTLVSSRFGDVCLFLLIGLSCFINSKYMFCMIIFFLIIFTKSARFPFISWLLEAMRAPTPVSSLVHSSTLVAAGIWFSMRYDYVQYFRESIYFRVLLILTILITALRRLFFVDLKKIIALSTCKNIAWCILYLIYGDLALSLFQLLRHGVSKCILFMLVGDVMRGSGGSQGRNCVYGTSLYGNWKLFRSILVVLGLAGVPFIGVFFTKHFLLSMFVKVVNIVVCSIVCLCMFMSYLYSFRLCAILFKIKSRIRLGVLFFFKSGLMVFFWLFIKFYVFLMLDETVYLNRFISFALIVFQLLSILITYMFYDSNLISKWSSSLFGCDNLVELCYTKFYRMLKSVRLFFFRWDKIVIELFTGIGSYNVGYLFIWVLLKLLMISGFALIIYLLIW